MIALDTNVLLRLLLDDEPRQAGRAQALVERTASAGEADFSDYLVGESAAARGAAVTYTFDRALLAHPGFVRPG